MPGCPPLSWLLGPLHSGLERNVIIFLLRHFFIQTHSEIQVVLNISLCPETWSYNAKLPHVC